jgi:hypothetical protein
MVQVSALRSDAGMFTASYPNTQFCQVCNDAISQEIFGGDMILCVLKSEEIVFGLWQ